MTRRFDGRVHCPNCGTRHTAETAFERWMRNHVDLDSSSGIVRFDLDVLVHRYLTIRDKKGPREIQCLMFVEVKTRGAGIRKEQRDTLSLLSQALNNRRPNMHQTELGRRLGGHCYLAKAKSLLLNRDIGLRMYGGHLLRLAGDAPDTSEWMKWDGLSINEEMLVELLAMERHPWNPIEKFDWRRRYSDFAQAKAQPLLFEEPAP